MPGYLFDIPFFQRNEITLYPIVIFKIIYRSVGFRIDSKLSVLQIYNKIQALGNNKNRREPRLDPCGTPDVETTFAKLI